MEKQKSQGKPQSAQKSRPKAMPTHSRSKSSTSHSTSHSKSTGAGRSEALSRPCPEHSFLTDVADVRQMEQGLLQLLDDFHSGKLQAFAGQDCTFEKMDQVREQQEKLARRHFDLDTVNDIHGNDTAESREASNTKLEKLMDNLQELCVSIQSLQQDYPVNST